MRAKWATTVSRRSLMLQFFVLAPLLKSGGLFETVVDQPKVAAADPLEFVEIDGWILRRSDIA